MREKDQKILAEFITKNLYKHAGATTRQRVKDLIFDFFDEELGGMSIHEMIIVAKEKYPEKFI